MHRAGSLEGCTAEILRPIPRGNSRAVALRGSPKRQAPQGDGRRWPPRSLTVIASAAKQSWNLSADAFLDCFAALAMTRTPGRTVKVFCPTAQAVSLYRKPLFCENNPMHSRKEIDFKQKFGGWISDSHPTNSTPPRSALVPAAGSPNRRRAGRSGPWRPRRPSPSPGRSRGCGRAATAIPPRCRS